MKDNKMINAFDSIQPDEGAKNRALGKIRQRYDQQHKKARFYRPAIALAATAAVFTLFVLGGGLPIFDHNGSLPAPGANAFSLTAYAAEPQPDGTIRTGRQIEISQSSFSDGSDGNGIIDNITGITAIFSEEDGFEVSMFTSIALKVEGENIQTVTLSVDEGYFSVTRTDNDPMMTIERVGETVTLERGELGNMLFWGMDLRADLRDGTQAPLHSEMGSGLVYAYSIGASDAGPVAYSISASGDGPTDYIEITADTEGESFSYRFDGTAINNVTIKAVVTFEDGEVQEQTIVYDTRKGTLVLSEM